MYTAGIENVVKVWDLRKEEVAMTLKGHADTVTGLALSPDGTHLLTNAMDNTLRVRPACWKLDNRSAISRSRSVKTLGKTLQDFHRKVIMIVAVVMAYNACISAYHGGLLPSVWPEDSWPGKLHRAWSSRWDSG